MIQTVLNQYSLNYFNMNERYVFDLDNTLIMTNQLNSISYNYALAQLGMQPIESSIRITRSIVFNNYPGLTDFQREEIIAIKQNYFKDNINLTYLNIRLITLLQSKETEHCILWTSADEERVSALLRYYNLEKHFTSTVFSEKRILVDDFNKICEVFNCNSASLLFFEDDAKIVKELKLLGQKVFVVNLPNLL